MYTCNIIFDDPLNGTTTKDINLAFIPREGDVLQFPDSDADYSEDMWTVTEIHVLYLSDGSVEGFRIYTESVNNSL